jgi:hypothetical protein
MLHRLSNVGSFRDRSRRRRKLARRCVPVLEGLETRTLLSFNAPFTFHLARDANSVAVADFNGDGRQDFVVADDTTPGQLTVLLGNGDGSFQSAGTFPSGLPFTSVVAVGDFNGDGIPDLAVGGYGASIDILLGNGDGTFRNTGSFTFTNDDGAVPQSIAVADFHGNGKQDLVVASAVEGSPEPLVELPGNGDGTFQSPVNLGFSSSFAVAGDINNDGKPDLIAGSTISASLLLGNGDGSFQGPVPFAPGLPLTVTDVNGDGIPDLVFATPQGISERLGNGDGTFQDPIHVNLPANAQGTVLGVGDFTNDGQLDLIFRSGNDAVSVVLNNGDGTVAAAPAYAAGAFPSAIAAGDFTGDGLPDLVTVGADGQAHILLNNGDGTFRSGSTLAAPDVGTSVVVGDFTGDGILDIAVLRRDFNNHSLVSVFLGNGDATFQDAKIIDLGTGTASGEGKIVAQDFNGDGQLDLAVLFQDNTTRQNLVEVLLGNGDGTFQATAPHQVHAGTDSDASGLAVADFNRDGKLDLVTVNEVSSDANVLLGNGDGTFQDPVRIAIGGGPFDVAVGDFTGDGIPDLVTANVVNNTVSVLLGNGDGTFQAPVTYPVGVTPGAVVVGDFNGNGIADIAVADSNSVSVLQGNGNGTFQSAVSYLVGRDARALVAADFNGDHALDLAVANFGSNDVSVLINRADGRAGAARTAAAVDTLFADARPGSGSPVAGQQPAVAPVNAAFSDALVETISWPQPRQLVADAGTLAHRHKGDWTEAAMAGLPDPLLGELAEVV